MKGKKFTKKKLKFVAKNNVRISFHLYKLSNYKIVT